MNKRRTFEVIRIGKPDVQIPVSMGFPFEAAHKVSEEQRLATIQINDCSLFTDREKTIQETKDLNILELLDYVRTNRAQIEFPNLELAGWGSWIWWPANTQRGFRYAHYNVNYTRKTK